MPTSINPLESNSYAHTNKENTSILEFNGPIANGDVKPLLKIYVSTDDLDDLEAYLYGDKTVEDNDLIYDYRSRHLINSSGWLQTKKMDHSDKVSATNQQISKSKYAYIHDNPHFSYLLSAYFNMIILLRMMMHGSVKQKFLIL